MTSTTSKFWPTCLSVHVLRAALIPHINRFGNFIGEAAESEEASEAGIEASDYVYDEAEDEPAVTGHELMEVDGTAST